MSVPTLDSIEALLLSGEALRDRITIIAKRLETLGEYSAEQALIVATDIVRSKIRKRKTEHDLETNQQE